MLPDVFITCVSLLLANMKEQDQVEQRESFEGTGSTCKWHTLFSRMTLLQSARPKTRTDVGTELEMRLLPTVHEGTVPVAWSWLGHWGPTAALMESRCPRNGSAATQIQPGRDLHTAGQGHAQPCLHLAQHLWWGCRDRWPVRSLPGLWSSPLFSKVGNGYWGYLLVAEDNPPSPQH